MMAAEPSIALVTGASSGIGQACAEQLAVLGFRVYGTSRQASFRPHSFEPLVMDVTDDNSVGRGVAGLLRQHGRIDCVINSAGYGLGGSVEDTSVEEARHQFEANLFGVLRVCRAVLPSMRRQRSGLIVNISSLAGLFGLPFQGLYCASKFALEGLSESLRLETRPFGIRVVLIEPGDVRTAITSNRVFALASRDGSPYSNTFSRAFAVVQKEESKGVPPTEVATLVARIVRARRTRLRYTVGHPSQRVSALLKRTLPWSICERLLLSFYGATTASDGSPQDTQRSDRASSTNR
jgi:NAD(P)-dependent dehydrogenase (short-subunit alcohol dehydrogenase family)